MPFNKQQSFVATERKNIASREVEANCLGICLKNRDAISVISGIVRSSNDFNWQEHKHIWEAITKLYNANAQVDPITVIDELSKNNQLNTVGGKTYVNGLQDLVLNAEKADEYAKRVLEWAVLREVRNSCEKTMELINSGDIQDAIGVIDLHTREIMDSGSRVTKGSVYSVRELENETLAAVVKAYEGGADDSLIPTGFTDFDREIGGSALGEYNVCGARSNMGKSACIAQLALNSAELSGYPSIFFSLEMSKKTLMNRLISMKSGIPATDIRRGNIDSKQLDKVKQSLRELSEVPLHIDETTGLSAMEIKSKIKRVISKFGPVGVVVVDYMRLVKAPFNSEDGHLAIAENSKYFKEIAKECNVSLWLISQLNRNVEMRQDKRPVMSDISGSDAIVADADLISLLYRPKYYEKKTNLGNKSSSYAQGSNSYAQKQQNMGNQVGDGEPDIVEFIVEKNRNGGVGVVKLFFEPHLSRLSDYHGSDEY